MCGGRTYVCMYVYIYTYIYIYICTCKGRTFYLLGVFGRNLTTARTRGYKICKQLYEYVIIYYVITEGSRRNYVYIYIYIYNTPWINKPPPLIKSQAPES